MNSFINSKKIKPLKNMIKKNIYPIMHLFTKECSIKHKKLVVHFTHHKCGTRWFNEIFYELSKKFNIKYQRALQEDLDIDTNIWLEWHSKVDFTSLPQYVGSHMIRDPRDITISAYFYHLWCEEQWCEVQKKEYNNMSYKEYLNTFSQEEGILIEMKNKLEKQNTTGSVIEDIELWDYSNPNIMELKYEDVITDSDYWFAKIFRKYGFNEIEIEKALKIAEKYSFQNRAKRNLGDEDRKSHLRKGTPGDWKNYFIKKHKKEFKDLYGDTLIKLGYEKDKSW